MSSPVARSCVAAFSFTFWTRKTGTAFEPIRSAFATIQKTSPFFARNRKRSRSPAAPKHPEMSQGRSTVCAWSGSSLGSRSTTTGSTASAMKTGLELPEGDVRANSKPLREAPDAVTNPRVG